MNLDAALAHLLPHWRDTALLQAILFDDEAARHAWDRWSDDAGDVMRALGNDAIVARPMLPLLYDSVRRNHLDLQPHVATYLRSAYVRESLRTKSYFAIVDEICNMLERAGVRYQLIKGAAIARELYSEPALRHAHDVELEVDDVAAARAAIGFDVHPSGLPVRLHAGIRDVPPLARVLTNAAQSMSRQSCRWVADAYLMIRAGQKEGGSSLAARAQLAYLRDSFLLDVTVPPPHEPSAEELEQTIRGLYAGRFQWWRALFREGDADLRRMLIITLLRPTPLRRAVAYARRVL